MHNPDIAFQGEVMLLNWSESSARGRTATFLLSEEGESHPFKDFTIKNGKRAGQRFMAVLVQIDEDEQPVQQRKTGAQQAALLCKSEDFWAWASRRQFDPVNSEETARQFILDSLQITSRSQIDRQPAIAERFQHSIVVPFDAYRSTLEPKL